MKEIKAFIKPHKLDSVIAALRHLSGLTGVSVSDVRGFGRGLGEKSGFEPHIRIELASGDELVEEFIGAIQVAAHTGLKGDGKIYITPIEDVVRISTNQRGESAV